MRLVFTPLGWADYVHWQTADRSKLKRVNRLLEDVLRQPHSGLGKPEPLKHRMSGAWSRRIDDEHRLVYVLAGDDVIVLQARHHY